MRDNIPIGLHIGYILLIFASGFAIAAIKSVGWAVKEVDSIYTNPRITKSTYGLFSFCRYRKSSSEDCYKYVTISGKLSATQGLAVTGMVCYIISALLISVFEYRYNRNKTVNHSRIALIVSIIFAQFGVLFSLIAVGLFTVRDDHISVDADLYYCFYLSIVAAIFAAVGSILAYVKRPGMVEQPGTVIMTPGMNGAGANVSIITNNQHMHQHTGQLAMDAGFPPPAYPSGNPYAQPAAHPAPHQRLHENGGHRYQHQTPPQNGSHNQQPPQNRFHHKQPPQNGSHHQQPPQNRFHHKQPPQNGSHHQQPPQNRLHHQQPPQNESHHQQPSQYGPEYQSPPQNGTEYQPATNDQFQYQSPPQNGSEYQPATNDQFQYQSPPQNGSEYQPATNDQFKYQSPPENGPDYETPPKYAKTPSAIEFSLDEEERASYNV